MNFNMCTFSAFVKKGGTVLQTEFVLYKFSFFTKIKYCKQVLKGEY